MPEPYIPNFVTVHLGPPDSYAENTTLTFPDYIKNVASSEIYPTWPESALRANIYAQISFALNRIFTEYYRSRGYDFDITNSTAYDQSFVQNREIFQNISDIVDDIFNSYVRRQGSVEPYFTQYCNGTTSTCEGLSQWGTVELANNGLGPYDILTYYYGDDIDIVQNVPVRNNTPSYPGVPLRLGDIGNDVKTKQVQLNRISRNYPAIPKISTVDGVFGQETEDAVRAFQRIFNLTEDGIIGNATWYRISYLYNSVKRLSELDSEGISFEEIAQQFPGLLRLGDTGVAVSSMQYYLAVIGTFYDEIPLINVTGTFDTETQNAVIAFQKVYGLTPDGIVGQLTWQDMVRAYRGIVADTPQIEGGLPLYPGYALTSGSQGEPVRLIQTWLSAISETYPNIPAVPVTGVYGNQTQASVRAFQQQFGIPVTGAVGPVTWNQIASVYSDLTLGFDKQPEQFPGSTLTATDASELA